MGCCHKVTHLPILPYPRPVSHSAKDMGPMEKVTDEEKAEETTLSPPLTRFQATGAHPNTGYAQARVIGEFRTLR
jgi:hypothetical protein